MLKHLKVQTDFTKRNKKVNKMHRAQTVKKKIQNAIPQGTAAKAFRTQQLSTAKVKEGEDCRGIRQRARNWTERRGERVRGEGTHHWGRRWASCSEMPWRSAVGVRELKNGEKTENPRNGFAWNSGKKRESLRGKKRSCCCCCCRCCSLVGLVVVWVWLFIYTQHKRRKARELIVGFFQHGKLKLNKEKRSFFIQIPISDSPNALAFHRNY